jgi:hypothetical protein
MQDIWERTDEEFRPIWTTGRGSAKRNFTVFQTELYNRILNVERWIVCMPLSVNVFATLATQ